MPDGLLPADERFPHFAIGAADRRLPGAAATLQAGIANNDTNLVARAHEALTHGYTTAFLAGAATLLTAALVATLTITTKHTQSSEATPAETGRAPREP